MSYKNKCETLFKEHEKLKKDYNKLLVMYEMETSYRKGIIKTPPEIKDTPKVEIEDKEITTIRGLKNQIHNLRLDRVMLTSSIEKKKKSIGNHYFCRSESSRVSSLTQKINSKEKLLSERIKSSVD